MYNGYIWHGSWFHLFFFWCVINFLRVMIIPEPGWVGTAWGWPQACWGMIVWVFACKIYIPFKPSQALQVGRVSRVPPPLFAILCLMFSLCLHVFSVRECTKQWYTGSMWSQECVCVCVFALSAPLAQICDRHFSWRRSLKSLPRQLGVRVSVRVSSCMSLCGHLPILTPKLQSPTTPSLHPLFNFLLLFFHSSVKTSRVGVDRGWLAVIADCSVHMSRSNICACISIFFLYMWNSLKEGRPFSLQQNKSITFWNIGVSECFSAA